MNLEDWDKAQVLAQQWMGEVCESLPTKISAQESKISLGEAWDRFLVQARGRDLSAATVYKYELLRRRMEDFAKRRRLELLEEFDLDTLEAFQAEWHEGALARSKKMERLKAFFRAASIRKWIENNPAIHLCPPKVKRRPTLPFSVEEMKAILEAVRIYPDKSGKTGRPNAIRLHAFILVARYSGLRIGDLTSLRIDKVVGNRIFLYTQKTGQPVYCVVPQFVLDALRIASPLSDKHFFWTGNSTLHTAIGTWQRSLRKLFGLANVANGFAHRFRDTFAVELLLAGVPTEEVAALLGHSNITITQKHYSPWVRSRQLQLEANLERAWSRDAIALLNMKLKPNLQRPEGELPN